MLLAVNIFLFRNRTLHLGTNYTMYNWLPCTGYPVMNRTLHRRPIVGCSIGRLPDRIDWRIKFCKFCNSANSIAFRYSRRIPDFVSQFCKFCCHIPLISTITRFAPLRALIPAPYKNVGVEAIVLKCME